MGTDEGKDPNEDQDAATARGAAATAKAQAADISEAQNKDHQAEPVPFKVSSSEGK
jgi:hypothetical protein